MSQIIQVYKAEIQEDRIDALVKQQKQVANFLKKRPGFLGNSTFVIEKNSSKRTEDNFLSILQFDSTTSFQSALDALSAYSEHHSDLKSSDIFSGNLLSIKIYKSQGLTPHELLPGTLLSMSSRVAEPGRAQELLDDFELMFRELAPIAGLRGWSFGSQNDLSELIFGFAFWDDEASYRISLPKNSSYELALYRKI